MIGDAVLGKNESAGVGPIVQMHRKVMIATPTMNGMVTAEYSISLSHSSRLGAKVGVEFIPIILKAEHNLDRGRNTLLQMAAKSDCTDLIWIDADQGWLPELAIKFLEYPVDIVGAPIRMKEEREEKYNVKVAAGGIIPICEKTRLLMPESIGTGFLRMSRKAFMALYESGEEVTDDRGGTIRWAYKYGPEGGRLMGEDVYAAHRLKQLGFQYYLDPQSTPDHVGQKTFQGDFLTWLKRKQQEEAARSAAQLPNVTPISESQSPAPATATPTKQ